MNDLIKSFEARGWEFTIEEKASFGWEDIVWFKSPRMLKKVRLGEKKKLIEITEEQLSKIEIESIIVEWKHDLLSQFYYKIVEDMARQYKLLMMKDMEPPRSQRISFDVEWKL